MPNAANRSRYFLDIEPELRNRLKAFAALRGKTMKEWLTEAIITKLEDEMDAAEAVKLIDTHPRFRKILKAMIKLTVDEINILRAAHSLPARTYQQGWNAVKNLVDRNE